MDKANPLAPDDADKNSGLVKRQTFAAASSEIDMIWSHLFRHNLPGEIHAKRSQCQDKTHQEQRHLLLNVDRCNALQSHRYVCVVADSQSQNQSLSLPSARRNPGERYRQITNQTRHM
jgi:hypothetical protein